MSDPKNDDHSAYPDDYLNTEADQNKKRNKTEDYMESEKNQKEKDEDILSEDERIDKPEE